MKRSHRIRRNRKGAITAEYVTTLWVFLLFCLFPLLNLGTMGLRAFFLWFSAEQAVMVGCKCKTWSTTITDGSTTYIPATLGVQQAAQLVHDSFPGWDFGTPAAPSHLSTTSTIAQIWQEPIQDTTGTLPVLGPNTTALATPPDVTNYVPLIRVIVTGCIYPMLPMTLGNGLQIVGLTTPWPMTARAQAVFENPSGLTL